MTHIVVATPCYGGLVTQRYMQSICALLDHGSRNALQVSVELLGYDSLIPRARNTLVAAFLDKPDATHLLFVDADIGFAPEQVERLLDFNVEVVAGMYPLKIVHYDHDIPARLASGERLETAQLRYVGTIIKGEGAEMRDGFAAAVHAGTGFMLIQRQALLRLMRAHPELAYTACHNAASPSRSPNQFALFDTMIDPATREYLSEDYAFCQRWRAIGGRIWLDTRSQLTHVGPRDFVGDAGQRQAHHAVEAQIVFDPPTRREAA